MSFWTNCKKCGSQVYMAKVQPSNEYYSRWLPFEDDLLIDCHLENCLGIRRITSISTSNQKSKKQVKFFLVPKFQFGDVY